MFVRRRGVARGDLLAGAFEDEVGGTAQRGEEGVRLPQPAVHQFQGSRKRMAKIGSHDPIGGKIYVL